MNIMKKMRNRVIFAVVTMICIVVAASCERKSVKQETHDSAMDSIVIGAEPVDTVVPKEKKTVKTEKKQKKAEKKEEPVKQETKVEEVPTEIGASPDAVYFLDDSETESTPKFPDGEKALKKLLKKSLRKGQKGEKARFRASIVIKKDGTVGRVQFTECGYNDEYKPEIVAALQSLPAFTPGTKDGKPVDSWFYLTWKR